MQRAGLRKVLRNNGRNNMIRQQGAVRKELIENVGLDNDGRSLCYARMCAAWNKSCIAFLHCM